LRAGNDTETYAFVGLPRSARGSCCRLSPISEQATTGGGDPATTNPRRPYPIATMRSIGILASSAIAGSTLTSNFISASESRSFGRVIIFMYLQ
jgi:hypothetical protein